jgi:hypothetical protein
MLRYFEFEPPLFEIRITQCRPAAAASAGRLDHLGFSDLPESS